MIDDDDDDDDDVVDNGDDCHRCKRMIELNQ